MRPHLDAVGSVSGLVFTPCGAIPATLFWEGAWIKSLHAHEPIQKKDRESLPLIFPGFIDLHVHGAAGRDVMEAGDAASAIAAMHLRHGTTSMLATTMTAPITAIKHALAGIARAMQRQAGRGLPTSAANQAPSQLASGSGHHHDDLPEPEAQILGVHLEGPYLSAQKLGAQPPHTKTASIAEVMALHQIAPLRVITLAPEHEEHLRLMLDLKEAGFRVQLGHSSASYEQACEAFRCGAHSVTHLFNAMSALHHRAPGLVGAALAHANYAEVIPDLLHVHPGAILAAHRAIPGLYAVTDATAAAGMPDGSYRLGEHQVFRCLGAVRLADGTLAGSALTMDAAFRNLLSIGLSLTQASDMLSKRPAAMLGLEDRGSIEPGFRADLVVFDRETMVLKQVVVGGQQLAFNP